MDAKLSRTKPVLSITELEAQLTELAGHCNAAEYRWLTLLAEFDSRNGWSDGSTHSCAHWLNWKCGIDVGAAREKVRVAHALQKLPRISASMARGELSYSKVRAMTRVACEATEDVLLMIALHGTADHVEKLVRTYRRAQEAEELTREAQQRLNRRLTFSHDYDGSLIIKGRLPAEVGAMVMEALDKAVEAMPRPDVSAETSEPKPTLSVRRADALGILAESFLKHGAEAMSGGERHQVVVHVDAQTLQESVAGRCELENGPALAAETARRLACDSSVVKILENAQGEPLDIGRKSRSIPPAIRRALNARDQGCRFPGCTHKRYVDAHHIRHWAHGGETKASNLVTLCRFHHHSVHEGKVRIKVLDDGALRFIRSDGRAFMSRVPALLGDWKQLPVLNSAQGLPINRDTATTRWRGESMDYGTAIDAMLYRVRRTRSVSAESCEQAGIS